MFITQVNRTIEMHDAMLEITERKITEQTENITSLLQTVERLNEAIKQSRWSTRSMDDKVTGVMLNILEVSND